MHDSLHENVAGYDEICSNGCWFCSVWTVPTKDIRYYWKV